ncbi:hypothetical protein B0J12DRAFT_646514 [Macrophomina phaseolina]|uniref:Uncharacterized protein n=1 Tax=Macrophomina phaseolina TaxID=35725 RepID=A0ABQ8GMX3_9PEZI|nr:hypothetical protein B0J12DRAFT_646514 [Macrophomina phaseolina]
MHALAALQHPAPTSPASCSLFPSANNSTAPFAPRRTGNLLPCAMADAAAKKAARPAKTVFKLEAPFTHVQWPQLTTTDHDIMLEMLTNLLVPIGQHRSAHITLSKGKRSKKRKRRGTQGEPQPIAASPPPAPDLKRYITVGINSTTRHLEQLAQGADAPPSPEPAQRKTGSVEQPCPAATGETGAPYSPKSLRHLPLIFTLQPPSSITTAHLPLLAQTASPRRASSQSARLIPLKPSSEPKLAAALGLPRVGVIGIMEEAPGAGPLIEYARAKVSATEVPWLREASEGLYLPVNVRAEQAGTTTGPKR